MNTIKDRRMVMLGRKDGKVMLTYDVYLTPDQVVPGADYEALYRVVTYNETSKTLSLAREGKISENNFFTSCEQNKDFFASIEIKKIIITNPGVLYNLSNYKAGELSATPVVNRPAFKAPEIIEHKLNDTVIVVLKETTFCDGFISANVYFKFLHKKITIQIQNPFIRSYHDSVKNYFINKLGVKKVECIVNLKLKNLDIIETITDAPTLSLIDENFVEIIYEEVIEKKVLSGGENDVTILEDAVKNILLSLENVEEWFLKRMITESKTKHFHHLSYLSDKHLAGTFKLRIIKNPLSFIFLLKESENHFLVWETYNTEEATYIWKIDSFNLEKEITEIVGKINWLKRGNKLEYKRKEKNNFYTIDHIYQGSGNGFKPWLEKLKNILAQPDSQHS